MLASLTVNVSQPLTFLFSHPTYTVGNANNFCLENLFLRHSIINFKPFIVIFKSSSNKCKNFVYWSCKRKWGYNRALFTQCTLAGRGVILLRLPVTFHKCSSNGVQWRVSIGGVLLSIKKKLNKNSLYRDSLEQHTLTFEATLLVAAWRKIVGERRSSLHLTKVT